MTLDLVLSKFGPLGKGARERLQQEVQRQLIEEAFIGRIQETYGMDLNRYSSSNFGRMSYGTTLLFMDLLDKSFSRAGVTLPPDPTVLETGVGTWNYVEGIYNFVKVNSGSDTVKIHGIEYYDNPENSRVKNRISGLGGVTYSHMDFFSMPVSEEYDLVVANHPLATEVVYNHWDIPYRPLEEFWSRAINMLKPGGVLFATGYLYNEGASAFNSFPKQERISNGKYESPVATINGINMFGVKGFDNNIVMMARKAA